MTFKVGVEKFYLQKCDDMLSVYKIKEDGLEKIASYDLCDDINDIDNNIVDVDIIIDILKNFKTKRLEIQRRYPIR